MADRGRRLLVQSEAPGLAQGRSELQLIAEILWRNGAADVDDALEQYRADWPIPDGREVERPVESTAEIRIDESLEAFRVLARADSWVACSALPNVWITVEGKGFDLDEVVLVTIKNLQQYIDGTRAHLLTPREHRRSRNR